MTTNACTIGLDIGGTKIAAGLVDFPAARVLASSVVPTEAVRGGRHVLELCLQLTAELADQASAQGRRLEGIGIGIAETVNRQGQVTSAQTIDWRGWDPAEPFLRWAPVVVDSDARAGALAEARLGKGAQHRDFIYVTIGTGISYAPVLHGSPFPGSRGNAIVFANAALTTECDHCGRPSKTVLEDFASGPALVKRFAEVGGTARHGHDVLAAAHTGSDTAKRIVESAARAVGAGVAQLVNALDPEVVVVGGGLGTATGLYWDTFVDSVRAHIWSPETRDLSIYQSQMVQAGMIGAALLGLKVERERHHSEHSNHLQAVEPNSL